MTKRERGPTHVQADRARARADAAMSAYGFRPLDKQPKWDGILFRQYKNDDEGFVSIAFTDSDLLLDALEFDHMLHARIMKAHNGWNGLNQPRGVKP